MTELSTAMELAEFDVKIETIFGRPVWFSRAGRPITFSEHAELSADRSYAQLELTRVGRINRRRWTRCEISTVWLGMDIGSGSMPVLFETMIFGGPLHHRQWRYATEDDAFKGHAQARSALALAIQEKIDKRRKAKVYHEVKPKATYKYRHHDRRRS